MLRKSLKIIFSFLVLLTVFNFGNFSDKKVDFHLISYAQAQSYDNLNNTQLDMACKSGDPAACAAQAERRSGLAMPLPDVKKDYGAMTDAELQSLCSSSDTSACTEVDARAAAKKARLTTACDGGDQAACDELNGKSAFTLAELKGENNGYNLFSGGVNYTLGALGAPLQILVRLILLPVASGILWLVGNAFDASLSVTVFNVGFAINTDIITSVWAIFRDFINVAFIFSLLYIAILTILGISTQNNKKILTSIILAAIFVNFSLFVTKIVFDTSNIISAALYNKMITASKEQSSKNGYDSVTVGGVIMSGFQLQKFYKAEAAPVDKSLWDKIVDKADELKAYFTANSLFNAVMNLILVCIAIWVFTYATVLLLMRLVGMIVLMVTSPLAFVGTAIPFLKSQSEEWWKNLINLSLIGPIFMFFMLLVVKFIGARGDIILGLKKTGTSVGVGEQTLTVLGEYLYFFIIVFLMITAVKETKKLSGALGAIIDKIVQALIVAIGLAITGGASAAMSGAGALAKMGATSSSGLARGLSRTYTGLANSAPSKFVGGIANSVLTGKKADDGTVTGRITNLLGDSTRNSFKKASGIDMAEISKGKEKWKKDYAKSVSNQADEIGPKEEFEKVKQLKTIQESVKTQAESNLRRSKDGDDEKTVKDFDTATETHTKNTEDKNASDERMKQLAIELNNAIHKSGAGSTEADDAQVKFNEEQNKNKDINRAFEESETKLTGAKKEFEDKKKDFVTKVEESMGTTLDKLQKEIDTTNDLIVQKTKEKNEFIANIEKKGFWTTGTTNSENKKLANQLRSGKGVENEDKKNLEAIKKALKDSGIDLGSGTVESKPKDDKDKKEKEKPKP